MNYLEALAQNRDHGVRIRRKSWDPGAFIISRNGEMIWDTDVPTAVKESPRGTPFHSRKGMLADDWEVEVRTAVKSVPVFEWTSELPDKPGFYAVRTERYALYIREVISWNGRLVVATDDRVVYCDDYASLRPGIQWCLIDPAKFSLVIEDGSE